MRYEEEPRAFNLLAGLALGLAFGASVALLLSLDLTHPRGGTRRGASPAVRRPL
ncbi:MAG: hypothetical protein ABFS34_03845 [Gemmatimonadota bacterium]